MLDECGMKDNVVWTKQATQRMIRLHGQFCVRVCVCVCCCCAVCCCRAQQGTKSHTNAFRAWSSFPFSASWNVECRITPHGLSRNMDKVPVSCSGFGIIAYRFPKQAKLNSDRQMRLLQMRLLRRDRADCRYNDKVCFDYITHVLGIHGFTETVVHSVFHSYTDFLTEPCRQTAGQTQFVWHVPISVVPAITFQRDSLVVQVGRRSTPIHHIFWFPRWIRLLVVYRSRKCRNRTTTQHFVLLLHLSTIFCATNNIIIIIIAQ